MLLAFTTGLVLSRAHSSAAAAADEVGPRWSSAADPTLSFDGPDGALVAKASGPDQSAASSSSSGGSGSSDAGGRGLLYNPQHPGVNTLKAHVIESQQFHDDAQREIRAICEDEYTSLPRFAADLDPRLGMWELLHDRRSTRAELASALQAYQTFLKASSAALEGFRGRLNAQIQAENDLYLVHLAQADDAHLKLAGLAFQGIGVTAAWAADLLVPKEHDGKVDGTGSGIATRPSPCHLKDCSCPPPDGFCAAEDNPESCAQVFDLYTSAWQLRCRRGVNFARSRNNLVHLTELLHGLIGETDAQAQSIARLLAGTGDPTTEVADASETKLESVAEMVREMDRKLHETCLRYQASSEATTRQYVEIVAAVEMGAVESENMGRTLQAKRAASERLELQNATAEDFSTTR